MKTPTLALCAIAACSSTTLAQVANPNPGWDSEWPALEGSFLSDYVQLTHSSKYIKAGESYFSPDGKMIIFQAIPLPEEGEKAGAHYSMYVAGVERDDSGAITGLGPAGLVSKPGSSNTCGWFHPTQPMKILFGSTRTAPDGSDVVGYQRENSRYSWQFPVEMEILAGDLTMKYDLSDEAKARAKAYQESGETKPPMVDMNDIVSVPSLSGAQPIWQREGYDAEARGRLTGVTSSTHAFSRARTTAISGCTTPRTRATRRWSPRTGTTAGRSSLRMGSRSATAPTGAATTCSRSSSRCSSSMRTAKSSVWKKSCS